MIFEYTNDKNRGELKAGMSREEVRNLFSSELYEFLKTPLCEKTTDAFPELEVHAHYNPMTDKLEGIEVFQPNRIIYKEKNLLLQYDYHNLIRVLKTNKVPFKEDLLGVDLEDGKIGVYAPHIDTDDDAYECTAVYVDLSEGGSLVIKEK